MAEQEPPGAASSRANNSIAASENAPTPDGATNENAPTSGVTSAAASSAPPLPSDAADPKKRKQQKRKEKRRRKRQQLAKEREEDEPSEESEDASAPASEAARPVGAGVASLLGQLETIVNKKNYGLGVDKDELRLDPVGPTSSKADEEPAAEEAEEELPPNRGLRCVSCLSLLCHDVHFDYLNGRLRIDTARMRVDNVRGLVVQRGKVYCRKMHYVGSNEPVGWTTSTKWVVMLRVEHTTFADNYLNNPEYAGTDKVKNKPKFKEEAPVAPLTVTPGYVPRDSAGKVVMDRYHTGQKWAWKL